MLFRNSSLAVHFAVGFCLVEARRQKVLELDGESQEELDKIQADIRRLEAQLRSCNGTVSKQELVKRLQETGCSLRQAEDMLHFLENHEALAIDHQSIRAKLSDAKNKSIFMGNESGIHDFLLGRAEVKLEGRGVRLKDEDIVAKQDVVAGIRAVAKLKEPLSASEESNVGAILLQAGMDSGVKFEAVQSCRMHSFKREGSLEILSAALSKMRLSVAPDRSAAWSKKLQRLEFACSPALEPHALDIKKQLQALTDAARKEGKAELEVRKESFQLPAEGKTRNMNDDEFTMLRALMQDAKMFQSSLMDALLGEKQAEPCAELERILVVMHQNDGSWDSQATIDEFGLFGGEKFWAAFSSELLSPGQITDRNPVLNDPQQASQELYARLRELRVILPERAHWRLSSDPSSQEKAIKSKARRRRLCVWGKLVLCWWGNPF